MGIGISFDKNNADITFKLSLPFLFTLYFSFEHKKLYSVLKENKDYDIDLYLYDKTDIIFRFKWGIDPRGMRGGNKFKWRDIYFNITDFILGDRQYNSVLVEEADIDIPMLEGSYPAHIEIREDTWKRPRWPIKQVVKRAHIDMAEHKGIPHPGKGESSWNCGDDATNGLCCPASSISEAVGKMVSNVYHSRIRYGGYDCLNWNKYKENNLI
jgi:hypothetical protein